MTPALPLFDSILEPIIFVLVIGGLAFKSIIAVKGFKLCYEARELLQLVKTCQRMAGNQQEQAAHLVSTVPAVTKAETKAAVKEAMHEVSTDSLRRSGEMRIPGSSECGG